MKYRCINTVKKHLYITSHEPAFHYSVLEVPAQHRSTPLLQRNIIILHSRAARSGDDHSCPAFALSYFRGRFRVFAFSRFRVFAFSRFRVFAFSRFRVFAFCCPFSRRKCRAPPGPRHTHTCSETSYRITEVECISRAQTTHFKLTSMFGRFEVRNLSEVFFQLSSDAAHPDCENRTVFWIGNG